MKKLKHILNEDIITELFEAKPFEYKELSRTVYSFNVNIDNKNVGFIVSFDRGEYKGIKAINVGFTPYPVPEKKINTTNVIYSSIIMTVVDIIFDFIKKNNPDTLMVYTEEKSKYNIYKYLIEKQTNQLSRYNTFYFDTAYTILISKTIKKVNSK